MKAFCSIAALAYIMIFICDWAKNMKSWLAVVLSGLIWGLLMLNQEVMASTTMNASAHTESIVLGMGCFWGAEKHMSELPGVVATEVGYAGGTSPAPTYESVLAEAHRQAPETYAEVVKVTFDTNRTSLHRILAAFWEHHDPTQGNRQGNDVGANYRSVILFDSPEQRRVAEQTMHEYQTALTHAGYGKITTEIAPLKAFYPAEVWHQKYLIKHPNGYCGLGGTGVAFPGDATPAHVPAPVSALNPHQLAFAQQLIVFEGKDCSYCRQFAHDMLQHWHASVPIAVSLSTQAPAGWTLKSALWATPTIVLFENGQEVSRYTGYDGDAPHFWRWVSDAILTPEQQEIAWHGGTERAFTGSFLDNHHSGTYVDAVTGQPLFRSDAKFNSHSGWPSFFAPVPGALVMKEDNSHGMHRVEVLSASSGIHLGHVFDDGPPPTGKRYCINSAVLRFVPDKP